MLRTRSTIPQPDSKPGMGFPRATDMEEGEAMDGHVSEAPSPQSRHWFLQFCRLMNYVSGIGGLLCSICSVLILGHADVRENLTQALLYSYGASFGLAIVLTELEWTRFFRLFVALESWLGRGLFYVFVGTLILSADTITLGLGAGQRTLVTVGGGWLCASGSLYFVLGLLCFRHLKEKQLLKIKARHDAEREMDELAERKQEIERLLEETEQKLERL